MSQDFDNNIPDFSKRKTALKILLFLSLISLFILVIQLTYIDELSPLQANLTIINSFVLFIISVTAKTYINDVSFINAIASFPSVGRTLLIA